MARAAETYRAARRNACRAERGVWGPQWYFGGHRNAPRWAIAKGVAPPNNQAAIYVERKANEGRKTATTSNAVHELLRRGDYAGAVRRFFSRKAAGVQSKGSPRARGD